MEILMNFLKGGQQKMQLGDDGGLFEFAYVENAVDAIVLGVRALLREAGFGRGAEVAGRDGDWEGRGRVAGEAFFITDDFPETWYGFARRVWREAGDRTEPHEVWVIPFWLLVIFAQISDWVCWFFTFGLVRPGDFNGRNIEILRDGNPVLSIEKARTKLGYKPRIGREEGVRRAVREALSPFGEFGKDK